MKKLIILFTILFIAFSSYGQKIDNQFYFRAGYSLPSEIEIVYFKEPLSSTIVDMRYGGVFELGSIFMFNSILSAKNMAFGINIDYLYLNFNYLMSTVYNNHQALTTYRVGSKIGPSFTYCLNDRMTFDIYVKIDISFTTKALEKDFDNKSNFYKSYNNYGFSSGFNLRFGQLICGFEYNAFRAILLENSGEILGNPDNINGKSDLSNSNFTIGLCF